MPVTLPIIARNEALFLPACLASIKDAVDEIIVLDTGSTDATPQIAAQAGAKVAHFPWCDDFAAARNRALEEATGDWILILDADERLAPHAAAALREATARDDIDFGYLPIHHATAIDADPADVISGKASLGPPTLVPRLFRRTPGLRWEGIIHEAVPYSWFAGRADRGILVHADIIHLGGIQSVRDERGKEERNLRLLRRWVQAEPGTPRAWCYLGHHLARVGDLDGAVRASEQLWEALAVALASGGPLPGIVSPTTLRAKLFFNLGQTDRAIQALRQARQWAEGRPALLDCLEHPNLVFLDAYAHEMLALRAPSPQQRQAELEAAVQRYGEALSLDGGLYPEAIDDGFTGWLAALRLGTAAVQLGRWSLAKAHFELALAAAPDPTDATIGIAEAHIGLGDFGTAASSLRALSDDPEQPDASILQAVALRALCRVEELDALLAKLSDCEPSDLAAPHRFDHLSALRAEQRDRTPPFVFIGGAGRSGTTLFRVMLHAHPRFHCGPEAKLVPILAELRTSWDRMMGPDLLEAGVTARLLDDSVRAFLATLLSGLGPEGIRIAEKTPHNALHFGYLARLFPSARFIHVVRDGRAVAASLVRQTWVDPTGEPAWFCQDLESAASYWQGVVGEARKQAAQALGRVLEVRYEELVTDPETLMRRVLDFLGEPWDDVGLQPERSDALLPVRESSSRAVGEPIHDRAVDRWRERLTTEEIRTVERVAGAALEELGYPGELS